MSMFQKMSFYRLYVNKGDVMKASYNYNGKWYVFAWFENTNNIIMAADANTDNERVIYIPVRQATGYSIKVNKKSLSSDRGAYGAIKFIQDCIRNNFMTVYVERIIQNFA